MVTSRTPGEKLFDILNVLFMLLMIVITLYPLLFVLFASFSDAFQFLKFRGILLRPLGFSVEAYQKVAENPLILTGYRNTILILLIGTSLNVLLTSLCAYVLSRKRLLLRKFFTIMVTLTMFFSGGLIPNYILIRMWLGLKNNVFAVILPTLISVYNMIIMRTAFASIPDSMEESAKMDGANDFTVLFRILIPLSLPTVAVMVLFYGVTHWNSWFNAMLYIDKRTMFPLQLVLREILVANDTTQMVQNVSLEEQGFVGETIKYATIIVATLPILALYPFLQKYFVTGVMIGAVKE